MSRPLRLIALVTVSLLACSPKPFTGSDTTQTNTGASNSCHVPAAPGPICDKAPAHLTEDPLGTGFFLDVWPQAELSAALGRRVVFGDVNGDKYPDFISIKTGVGRGQQHLWINELSEGGWRKFTDRTEGSGITTNRDGGEGQTMLMATFADVDNDGDLDLFSGSYSQEPAPSTKYDPDPNELYLNDGTGHFTRKEASGVSDPWPNTTAAAVFLDADRDGKLDLYLGNFMKVYPNLESYQSEFYKGTGDGTFLRMTEQVGLGASGPVGSQTSNFAKPVYGVTSCDWNDDGQPDLLVSTYSLMPDDLWKNDRGIFTNVSTETKFAMDDQPNPAEPWYRQGGNTFGAACGDYDNDGDIDVFNAETTHGDSPRSTADRSRILVNGGAANGYAFTRPELSATGIDRPLGPYDNEGDHGAAWLDFDNDGLLDLVIEQSAYPGNHAWLYHQKPDHTFEDVTDASGVGPSLIESNGLSVDDYDRDGDLDFLMGSVDNVNGVAAPEGREQIHLYQNRVGQKHSFLHVTLKGVTANRQGIGAKVTVTAGCLTQTREIYGGKGTFGAADPAYAHFGLGDVKRIDKVEVRWPTNPPKVDTYTDVAVNQFLEITEGSSELSCTPAVTP
ncbi:MAG: CRTAC1 family protein [Myxococcaceae bacterium]